MSQQATDDPTNTQKQLTDLENARSGYQAAVALWVHEGQGIWSKFTGMVYAHTILILTISAILTSNKADDLCLVRVILCILGLLICIAWMIITARSFVYHDYYVKSAREIENLYLESEVKTVVRGASIFTNIPVSFRKREQNEPFNFCRALTCVPSVRRCIYAVILSFGGLYVLFAIQ